MPRLFNTRFPRQIAPPETTGTVAPQSPVFVSPRRFKPGSSVQLKGASANCSANPSEISEFASLPWAVTARPVGPE